MDKRTAIRGLIFDFDGLILDTEKTIFQSWSELFDRYELPLSLEEWAQGIGVSEKDFDPFALLEAGLGRSVDRQALDPPRRGREGELIAQLPIRPGVEAYLEEAARRGLKLGVASSSGQDWVAGHLARLELIDYFETIRTSDDVERAKPDPAVYSTALEDLNLAPEEAIAIEDSPNGVLAAKRAGIFTLAVPNELTARLDLDHADMRLDSLADMPLGRLLELVQDHHG